MIVDGHLHAFRNGYGLFRGASPLGKTSDLVAYERLRAEHGITAGLVVCYEDEGIDPSNNTYVREIAATRPWISSVAYLRPAPAPSVEDAESLLAAGHIGIALYLPDAAAVEALKHWPPAVWERLSRSSAIVSLNARPQAIAELPPLIDAATGCAFVFSHLGLPGRWDAMPTRAQAAERLAPLLRLASRPNVGVKFSGLYAIDPVSPCVRALPCIELFLERFAPSDLHWGSDFSPALDWMSFGETMKVPGLSLLSSADRQMIFGESLMAKLSMAARGSTGRNSQAPAVLLGP